MLAVGSPGWGFRSPRGAAGRVQGLGDTPGADTQAPTPSLRDLPGSHCDSRHRRFLTLSLRFVLRPHAQADAGRHRLSPGPHDARKTRLRGPAVTPAPQESSCGSRSPREFRVPSGRPQSPPARGPASSHTRFPPSAPLEPRGLAGAGHRSPSAPTSVPPEVAAHHELRAVLTASRARSCRLCAPGGRVEDTDTPSQPPTIDHKGQASHLVSQDSPCPWPLQDVPARPEVSTGGPDPISGQVWGHSGSEGCVPPLPGVPAGS